MEILEYLTEQRSGRAASYLEPAHTHLHTCMCVVMPLEQLLLVAMSMRLGARLTSLLAGKIVVEGA